MSEIVPSIIKIKPYLQGVVLSDVISINFVLRSTQMLIPTH